MPKGLAASGATTTSTSSNGEDWSGGFLKWVLANLAAPQDMAAGMKLRMQPEQLRMLMQIAATDPSLLAVLGLRREDLLAEVEQAQRAEALRAQPAADKAACDRARWEAWARRYHARLLKEAQAGADPAQRMRVMKATNPRYVLRNWMAEQAIKLAEAGDYSEVWRVLKLLQRPFDDDAAQGLEQSLENGAICRAAPSLVYDGPVPQWARSLCVSCSS